MSLCILDNGHCTCQPEDGIECPAAEELRNKLATYERAIMGYGR